MLPALGAAVAAGLSRFGGAVAGLVSKTGRYAGLIPPVGGGTTSGGVANTLFTLSSAQSIAANLNAGLPTAVHEITVQVSGGPLALIGDLWLLCIAAAYGKYREGPCYNLLNSKSNYQAIWDTTNKTVAFKIVAEYSGLTGQAPRLRVPARARANSIVDYLNIGPTQETCGARPPFVLSRKAPNPGGFIGGILYSVAPSIFNPQGSLATTYGDAGTTTGGAQSDLPDDGRMITSWYRFDPGFQNPAPLLDNGSRSSMVSLVAAALTNQPSYLPASPPAIPASQFPQQSSRLYAAGTTEPSNIRQRVQNFARTLGFLGSGVSAKPSDGYKTEPVSSPDLKGVDNNTARFGGY